MATEKIDIPNLTNVIRKIGKDILVDIAIAIRNKDKVATGAMLDSLQSDVRLAVTSIILELKYNNYSLFVDQGRNPGKFAPVQKIKDWVKIRGLESEEQAINRAAYLINRKIYKMGIKPVNFVEDVLRKHRKSINDQLTTAARKDVEISIEKLTKELSK